MVTEIRMTNITKFRVIKISMFHYYSKKTLFVRDVENLEVSRIELLESVHCIYIYYFILIVWFAHDPS